MVIYFLTLAYPKEEGQNNLYSDLMTEIALRGHQLFIFTADEISKNTPPIEYENIHIENIYTGKVTKTKIFRKAINTILLESRYKKRIKNILNIKKLPDLLIYSTPPITFIGVVSYLKKLTGCHTYLLLKDIFPANAIDLGIIKPKSLIWYYFRRKEKKLYKISDRIGCMSKANVDYFMTNNKDIKHNKLEICYNSINPTPLELIKDNSKGILRKFKILNNSFKMIYGGNIGVPQGVPFIINVIEALRNDRSIQFVIVGDGTNFRLLEDYREKSHNEALILLNKLPKSDYLALLSTMDAGLLFLDERFTIPNYPSRILDYLDYSLPILAATDTVTDIRELLENNAIGLWSRAGDVKAFIKNIEKLKKDPNNCKAMGKRGRAFLESHFTVDKSADVILSKFKSQSINK